jgi:hypothetical protein
MTMRHRWTTVAALATTSVLATCALALGAARAQTPGAPPTVTIAAGAATPTITGADALGTGPTTFTFTSTTKAETDLSLLLVKPGRTVADVQGYVTSLKANAEPTRIAEYGSLVAGGSPTAGHPTTLTLTLQTGTYLLVNSTKAPKIVGQFAVGATANGATAPAPAKTVSLYDYGFRFSGSTLPRTGVVRFTNSGRTLHFALLARVSSAAAAHKAVRLLRAGKDKQAEGMVKGVQEVLSLVSPGVSNDVSLAGLPAGHYVLVCFYGDSHSHGKEHSMLGMERAVTLR